MNSKDQLTEIEECFEETQTEKGNIIHCGDMGILCPACRERKGFLLGTISQLKIRKEKIENKYHFPYHLDYEGTEEDKKDYEQITSDLKYYENKLKVAEEKEC
jgi:hypothetical protein